MAAKPVKQDVAALKALAEAGDPKAMIELSRLYYTGDQGLTLSREMSYEMALRAAKLGDPVAQYMTGLKTEYAEGTMRDMTKAFDWYRRAYEAGDPEACYQLATFFEGYKGLEAHMPTAIAYYEEGARRGSGNAQYQLAFRCLTGKGVRRDPGRALDLLDQAGRNGVPAAFEALGRLYLQGRDAPLDPGMAFDCFTRALAYFDVDVTISRGDCAVYYALCLLTGTGCAENRRLGREVLQVAASASNLVAQQVLQDRLIRSPMIQACFGHNAVMGFGTGAGDWDISELLQ